jgi:hypothetical protein
MTRTLTLCGYAILAAAALALEIAARRTHRTMSAGQALTALVRTRPFRPLVLATWLWLGWHTFVRGSFG